ncbi:MAG: hypothetical protein U0794_10145 [Isosphaeraceae bacterium]
MLRLDLKQRDEPHPGRAQGARSITSRRVGPSLRVSLTWFSSAELVALARGIQHEIARELVGAIGTEIVTGRVATTNSVMRCF